MANGTKRYTLGITLDKETLNPTFSNLLDNGTLFNFNDTTLRIFIENAIRDLVTADQIQVLTNKTLTDPTINAAGGAIVLPQSTTPSQTTEGAIVWDTDNDVLTIGTGSGRKILADTDSAQDISNKSIKSPTRLEVKKDTLANLLTYANSQSSSDNGQIVFTSDTKTLYQVVDSNLVSLASTPTTGEANTASNLGTGVGLYKQKQLVDLQFKSLKAGTNVSVVDNGDDVTLDTKTLVAGSNVTLTPTPTTITIGVTVPPGFIGTIVNVSSSPTTLLSTQDGNVILVNTSSTPITLNLPTSPTAGQRFVIKDERGTFGANAVTMTKDASHTIERLNANYLLEANFGTWTFVFDGVSNWVII